MLFVFKIKYFIILSYWWTRYRCKHPVRFLSVARAASTIDFSFTSGLSFILTLSIRRIMLHYCQWYSRLFAFIILSWVMIILISSLNWMNLIVQKSEKVKLWISRSVGWKSKLCFLVIIYNATLFVFKIKYFIILSYWRTTYLCKQPVRFCQSARAASTIDFSFSVICHSHSRYLSDAQCFIVVNNIHICSPSLYYHELWSF
jgi:hypothetical protein